MLPAIQRIDDRALAWFASANHGPLRPVLVGGARAANLLLPWALVSLGMLADGTPRSRAALARGWTGFVASAAVQNLLGKRATQRPRPDARRLPRGERRSTQPSTSSFPSGHVGAATAFAVGAAHDAAGIRPLLYAIAAGVAYAETYTGRHYVSDALVGAAVGAAVGAGTRRAVNRPVASW